MSVDSKTLERIKAQLREAQATGGNVQQDLYGHLTEVFNRVIMNHPTDAYDKFEEISALVKQTKLKFNDPKTDEVVNAQVFENKADLCEAEHLSMRKGLLNGKTLTHEGAKDDKSLLTNDKTFCIPNFEEEAEMLSWAGINFGQMDNFQIQCSMKKLAIMSGADKLRFAGKIFGTQKDYWIVSGELASNDENDPSLKMESRGRGCNQLCYWVTSNLLHDWIQLPDAQPRQIEASRLVKRVFTGNLNANVSTNPPFPGKERHFLRSMIARIFHATAISPKGLYEMSEPEGENEKPFMKFADEFVVPGAEELKTLETWGNTYPIVLKAGTCTLIAPAGMNEDEEAEWRTKNEEEDPTVELFRAINEHKGMPGTFKEEGDPGVAWLSKVVGDPQVYTKAGEGAGSVTYCVNVLKSLRWPGAVTVSKGGKFANVYVGHGLKRGDQSFNPTDPPEVLKDPQDQPEQPEPTPLHPPEEPVEDDTDKEDNEEGDE